MVLEAIEEGSNESEITIQPSLPKGSLQNISIEDACNLVANVKKLSNAGDQIELFFSVAETQPEVAFRSFITVLNSDARQHLRAMALRSFGRITHSSTKQEMVACQSEYSQELLKLLAEEVNGKSQYSSDLTRWAAAEAIMAIGYDLDHVQHIALGGLIDPPRRIANEIVQKKLEQGDSLKRFDSKNKLTPDYERYLEFWTYGATEMLFSEPYPNQTDCRNCLNSLQVRGVELAMYSQFNPQLQKEAYSLCKEIFEKYLSNKNAWLGESLKRFLKNDQDDDCNLLKLSEAITFRYEGSLDKLDLVSLVLSELEEEKVYTIDYQSEIEFLFFNAVKVCGNFNLVKLLQSDRDEHLSKGDIRIRQVVGSINTLKSELKSEQNKIWLNMSLFWSICQSFNGEEEVWHQEVINRLSKQRIKKNILDLDKLKNEIRKMSIKDCQSLSSCLSPLKEDILEKLHDWIRQADDSLDIQRSSIQCARDLERSVFTAAIWQLLLILYLSSVFLDFLSFHAWWRPLLAFLLIAAFCHLKLTSLKKSMKKLEEPNFDLMMKLEESKSKYKSLINSIAQDWQS